MTALRILHVDDEPDIREVVEISLGLDRDCVTRSCATGREALVSAADWSPDIILLDFMMPAMDGPATLAQLRANPATADIPVIFMTARAQSLDLDRFRLLGAVGTITKPFDPMTLAASVRAHVRARTTRLDAMRDEFLKRVERDLVALSAHYSEVAAGRSVEASLAEIRRIAHRIAGAGGIFGFDEISVAAANLEEAVILRRDGANAAKEIGAALDRVLACVEKSGGRHGTGSGVGK